MRYRKKVAVVAVLATLLAACGGDDDESGDDGSAATQPAGTTGTSEADGTAAPGTAPSASGGTLTMSDLGSAAVSFDPGQSSFNVRNFLYPVYDPLIRRAGDGSYHPSVATEWEYTSPTEFRVALREDVTFPDGTALDGEVVKANLEYAGTSTGPLASQLAAISEVEVVSPTEVLIHLSEPVPSLPMALSSTIGLMVHPDHVGSADLGNTPYGSGPYTLDEGRTIANDTYVYNKRPDHWDSEHYAYETVIVKVISDAQAVLNALRNNEVQVGSILSPRDVATAEQAGLSIQSVPYNVDGVQLYDRAGELVPALGNEQVREALNIAIDRQAIVDSIQLGQGAPTTQLLKPGFPGYDEALDAEYPYDVEAAKALLAEAGFADGFEFDVVSISVFDPQMQAMAAMWAEIGVTANIENVPPAQYIPSIISGEYPAAYLPYGVVDTFFDLPQLVLPDGGFNPFQSEDADITALYEEAKTVETEEERDALYQQINQRVVDLAWFVPIHTTPLFTAVAPGVQGVEFSVVFPQPFYDWAPAS